MRDIPGCKWLDQWTELAQKYVENIAFHKSFFKAFATENHSPITLK